MHVYLFFVLFFALFCSICLSEFSTLYFIGEFLLKSFHHSYPVMLERRVDQFVTFDDRKPVFELRGAVGLEIPHRPRE